eukprot:TRINITY_DN10783_c0_g1_i1.p1 TRINITY_DN10783_c0_g1~~TRINITY_DN10783_c0_g1_i1.p1  ORF type:complete len:476 (-),score=81.14 TRINITY_DN10783_c0_g1_i1:208-1635(-)
MSSTNKKKEAKRERKSNSTRHLSQSYGASPSPPISSKSLFEQKSAKKDWESEDLQSVHDFDSTFRLGVRLALEEQNRMDHTTLPANFATLFTTRVLPLRGNASSTAHSASFTDRAGLAFRELRRLFGVAEEQFGQSLCTEPLVGAQPGGGRSGATFMMTSDSLFIVKSIVDSEMMFLTSILGDYCRHCAKYQDTLLCRMIGLHTVCAPDTSEINILVMSNIFDPGVPIHEMYDLKGSTFQRYVDAQGLPPSATRVGSKPTSTQKDNAPEHTLREELLLVAESLEVKVFKDLNFLEADRTIDVGKKAAVDLLDRIANDVAFLEAHNIMDYSLLVGIHDAPLEKLLEKERKRKNKLVKKRFGPATAVELFAGKSPRKMSDSALKSQSVMGRLFGRKKMKDLRVGPAPWNGVCCERNGTQYYLGVIDILQSYTVGKWFESKLKAVWTFVADEQNNEVSSTDPERYRERFQEFLTSIVV